VSEFRARPSDRERHASQLRFLLRPGAVTPDHGELVQKAIVAVFPILEHLAEHAVEDAPGRIREIVEAIDVLHKAPRLFISALG